MLMNLLRQLFVQRKSARLFAEAQRLFREGAFEEAERAGAEYAKLSSDLADVHYLRALIALNQSEPAKAIQLLQNAAPNEFGLPHSGLEGSYGTLYPIYVRGLAYLATRQGKEAAAEFQKILDHRSILISDPIGALSYLQLGRALALTGDQTKAIKSYNDFLGVWKDADADIPVLKQAKAEYAKLQ